MNRRRSVRSTAQHIATREEWTDTRLLSTGPDAYDLRSPTGTVLVSVDQFDRTFLDLVGGVAVTANEASLRTFGQRGPMFEHSGVPPTIAKLETSIGALTAGVGPGQKNGKSRLWVCATLDKQNGVWVEVETVTDIADGPARLLSSAFTVTAVPSGSSNEQDPGYANDLKGYPTRFPGNFQHSYRPMRIRAGYVVDGVETVSRDFYQLRSLYPGAWVVELAVDPLGLELGNKIDGKTSFASVLFQVTPAGETGGSGNANASPSSSDSDVVQFKFAIDSSAASSPANPIELRTTLVELLAPDQGSHFPWNIGHVQQKTATTGGYTLCPPAILTGPTGIAAVRTESLSPGFGSNQPDRFYSYVGQDTEDVPRLLYDAPFAVKDGPSWHGQSLIPVGSTAGVDQARHRLRFVFPDYSIVLARYSVSYQTSPQLIATLQPLLDISHFASAFSGQSIDLNPDIDGRQLLPDQYFFRKAFPTFSVSQNSSNAVFVGGASPASYPDGVPYEYDLDIVVNGSARAGIDRDLVADVWTSTFPWPSLTAAMEKGVAEDEFYWLQTSRGRQEHQKANWLGSFLDCKFHAGIRFTVKRVGDIVCDFRVYRSFTGTFRLRLTPSQCRQLGENQTVAPLVQSFATSVIGLGSGAPSPPDAPGQLSLISP